MRKVAFALFVLLIAIVAIFATIALSSPPSQSTASNPYHDLRDQVLHVSRDKVGIPAPSNKGEVWGFLMDWGIDLGTTTVLAMSDGSASIYLSNGGGFMGGQGSPPIRDAAIKAVGIANKLKTQARPTSTYPLPKQGEIFFYLLTDDGVLRMTTSEQEMAKKSSPLSELGDAVQGVITQYRLLSKANKQQ
jgi:hypothetical protein